jgi:site-specific recombinase XerD
MASDLSGLIPIVENAVTSPHTKTAYRKALTAFFAWYRTAPVVGFCRSTVQAYRVHMEEAGQAVSSINMALSAIRKLAREAEEMGLLDQGTAGGILRIPGVRKLSQGQGNWLTRRQAEELLGLPNTKTLRGRRDRVILGLLLGCGLRREEAATLPLSALQERDGRPVLADVMGKGRKARTVAIPAWAYRDIREWIEAAGITDGMILRTIGGAHHIGPMAIYKTVLKYARRLGVDVRPHDLRRTFAKLARKGGAEWEQVQATLGHSQINTTQTYVGHDVDFADAACDHLQLDA